MAPRKKSADVLDLLDLEYEYPFPVTAADLNDHSKPFSFNLVASMIHTHLGIRDIEATDDFVRQLATSVQDSLWSECCRVSEKNPYSYQFQDLLLDKVLNIKVKWVDDPDTCKKRPTYYLAMKRDEGP